MQRERYPTTLWYAVGGALLGSFQFGYQAAILNTALPYITQEVNYNNVSVLSSAVVLGAAIGAICAGQIADCLGPRGAQLFNAVPFVFGTVLSAFSPFSFNGFLVGRLISGFGAGAASLYTPRYIAEISPTCLRGKLGSYNQVFINVGILFALIIGVPYEHGLVTVNILGTETYWWRVMIMVAVIPTALQVVVLLMCPESPVWLETQDHELADESCIKLWGPYAIVPDLESEDSYGSPANPLEEGPYRREGWGALLAPQYRWMVLLAVGLPVLQQASGINTVVYYSSVIFQKAGLHSPVVGSIFVGLVNLGFTVLASMLVDRMGRKPLLLYSFGIMAVTLIMVAITIWVPTSITVQGLTLVVIIVLYVSAFALGCGPIPWLYLSEILPDRIKGCTAAFATFCNWSGNLVVTLTFPLMIDGIGLGWSYMFYALLNLFAVWFIWRYAIETKCRRLAEIESMLLLPEQSGTTSWLWWPPWKSLSEGANMGQGEAAELNDSVIEGLMAAAPDHRQAWSPVA